MLSEGSNNLVSNTNLSRSANKGTRPQELNNGLTNAAKGGANAKGSVKKKSTFVPDSIFKRNMAEHRYKFSTDMAKILADRFDLNHQFDQANNEAQRTQGIDTMKAYAGLGGGVSLPALEYLRNYGPGGYQVQAKEHGLADSTKSEVLAKQWFALTKAAERGQQKLRNRLPGWTMNNGGK